MTHPNDMTADELRELVGQMADAALDLAQHLDMTERGLDPEYQPEARDRAVAMAYGLATYPYNLTAAHRDKAQPGVDATVFGAGGLQRQNLSYDALARQLDSDTLDIDPDESYVPAGPARPEGREIAQRINGPSHQPLSR